MTDRYENIRKALEMGPTPGPFSAVRSYSHGNQELIIRLTCNDEYGITENYCTVRNSLGDTWKTEASAAFIAACDPDTIRALLEERDALRKVLDDADNELDWLDGDIDKCDHSVGVCMCDYWDMRREMKAALSKEDSND